jgi:P pilus assembly chaperone PapD
MMRNDSLRLSVLFLLLAGVAAFAQTVSPVIVEYKEKGEGKIELTNNTLSPMVVFMQPQSFSISPDGKTSYRPLDPGIHVDLSTTSVRLEPKQSYIVFYKTHADTLPVWYTIYATFSPVQRGAGLNVRFMLPHTVYLYQKDPLQKDDIRISSATWDPQRKIVVCEVANNGKNYGRVREVSVQAGRDSEPSNGFPLLPGNPRHLEIPWTGKGSPESISLHFDRFDLKAPLGEKPINVASASNIASN